MAVRTHNDEGHAWWWDLRLCPVCHPLEPRSPVVEAIPVRPSRIAGALTVDSVGGPIEVTTFGDSRSAFLKTCYINSCRASFVGSSSESYCPSCRVAYDRGE
jgi:hypothetical protein